MLEKIHIETVCDDVGTTVKMYVTNQFISLKYLNRKYVNRLDGATPLHLAAEKCPDVRIIELLMQEIHQTKRDYKGFTALMNIVNFDRPIFWV